jgi:hypothetical protein
MVGCCQMLIDFKKEEENMLRLRLDQMFIYEAQFYPK